MLKISKHMFLIAVLVFTNAINAAPLVNGKAVFVGVGFDIPITGDIDTSNKTMSVDDWQFFGFPVSTANVEILDPGSYTRAAGDVTVPPGHVGAHMEITWNFNTFFVYMIWELDASGTIYTIIDSDTDGTPGHALNNGPFLGSTVYYEFESAPAGPAQPNVFLIVNVEGGSLQECTGDSKADVTINAMPTLVGGAELDSITWRIDDVFAGMDLSITESLTLGTHVIEATALTTTGQSDSESITVTVRDKTRPVVKVAFIDEHGDEVQSAEHGKFKISIEATDSCDPNPIITSSTATPTTTVSDGDKLFIDEKRGIRLPVTAVRVTVTARDASGNFSFTTSESSKTITLE